MTRNVQESDVAVRAEMYRGRLLPGWTRVDPEIAVSKVKKVRK